MTTAAKSSAADVARAAFLRMAEEARGWLASLDTRADAHPIADRVLVFPLDEPVQQRDSDSDVAGGRRVSSGLYVVEHERKNWRALVLRVSSGVESAALTPGAIIIMGEHVGMPFYFNEIELRLVKEHDVLGVLSFDGDHSLLPLLDVVRDALTAG